MVEASPNGVVNPNKAIRDAVISGETPSDWKWSSKAQELYEYQRIINTAWFSPQDETQPPMPDVLVAIDKLPIMVLGAYHLVPDGLGLRYKITMNEVWIERPIWELLETLTHELGHVYQNEVLEEKSKRNYHDKNFVGIMGEIGLQVKLGEGYHLSPPSDQSQFAGLMRWLNVDRPPHAVPEDGGGWVLPPGSKNWFDGDRGGRKGSSTLHKYVAEGCIKSRVCNFRAGLRDLQARCSYTNCLGIFRPVQS